jgi:uncharacterized protein (DUF433 family)
MRERITINQNIHFGKPCVADTRVPVLSALELVGEGLSFGEITQEYYPDLKTEDFRACLQYAIDVLGVEDTHTANKPPCTS